MLATVQLTACATYDAQKRAANKCNIDIDTYYLKELSLEQLQCIEDKGKNDPDFQSVQEKIDKKKKELDMADEKKLSDAQKAREAGYQNTKLISTRSTPSVGGKLRAEGIVPQEVIDETMFNFCTKNKLPYYRTTETVSGKTGPKMDQEFTEVSFECTKEKP
jgi:hypothetical protein